MLTVPSVSQHKPKYNPVLKNGRSGTGQVVQNNLGSTVCVIENPSSRNLFNNLEVAAHPLPTVPPCQPASLPAAHLQPAATPSLPDPSGPWHQLAAPTCGSSLHQAADSDLSSSFNFSSFKFLNFKLLCFQVDKLSSQARSHIPDWQSGMLLLLHPFAKEKSSLFNYIYVCFQNYDHRTWRKCST